MNASTILEYTANTMFLVLWASMLPIVVATVVGILVSVLQALTQIQEQTVSFAVKLVTISIVLLAMARWLGGEMQAFTLDIFNSFPYLSR